ncbi:RNP-1 like RNA-binding protein [Reticulomyxa filosa]|uniref:RNP-1 like RNA-binding protein n=1 Tax=Reticulomyxa filosa TaxID=46433 RepID=X6NS92_RETFI|nr:RNP-1 like RNA-binding protein [Reticulomyxa filosa]|eukprot:ETO28599.1 RNP-1 like RNA-binding protein [Reticulomyxa filosa]
MLEVYVRNISYQAREQDIYDHFSQCGKIERITLPRDLTSSKLKGYCFVKFSDNNEVLRACQLDGSELMGRNIEVRRNKGKINTPNASNVVNENQNTTNNCSKTLLLLHSLTPRQEYEHLTRESNNFFLFFCVYYNCNFYIQIRKEYRKVLSHTIAVLFCYVEFKDEASIDRAIALDGCIIHNRPIRVDYADPYQPKHQQQSLTKSNIEVVNNKNNNDIHTPSNKYVTVSQAPALSLNVINLQTPTNLITTRSRLESPLVTKLQHTKSNSLSNCKSGVQDAFCNPLNTALSPSLSCPPSPILFADGENVVPVDISDEIIASNDLVPREHNKIRDNQAAFSSGSLLSLYNFELDTSSAKNKSSNSITESQWFFDAKCYFCNSPLLFNCPSNCIIQPIPCHQCGNNQFILQ